MVEPCWNCKQIDEELYCPECVTTEPTGCVNCGYCTECSKVWSRLDFNGWRGRE
jgi:hypothetical protein